MKKLKVGLLFGGRSGEHEVAIASARSVFQALSDPANAEKYDLMPFYIQKDGQWKSLEIARSILESGAIHSADRTANLWQFPAEAAIVDVWFPVLHGPNGEDGTIQGLLTLMQKPFVGSGVLASSVGMDKIAMKMVFAQVGLPQVNYLAVSRTEVYSKSGEFAKLCDQLESELGYPCFVKPANLGSSVGISKVRTRAELEAALNSAASYDRRIIVEKGVVAREVECAVLGGDRANASVVGEIRFESDFYDYETKYTAGKSSHTIPANLPAEVTSLIQARSLQAFHAINASGLSRVDFFYVESTGEVLINEINTLPGFTATSMYPMMWEASGISYPNLVDRLIQIALDLDE